MAVPNSPQRGGSFGVGGVEWLEVWVVAPHVVVCGPGVGRFGISLQSSSRCECVRVLEFRFGRRLNLEPLNAYYALYGFDEFRPLNRIRSHVQGSSYFQHLIGID